MTDSTERQPLTGTRIADGAIRTDQTPGTYGRVQRDGDWIWMARTPNGLLADLVEHEVIEHADGTITVKNSVWSRATSTGMAISNAAFGGGL
jgi:hypothetical protein